jgi:spore coat polysaccharide biosynthesis protein SpsF
LSNSDLGPDQRIVAVVAARMGSNRFFGKSMAPLAGKPSLEHIVGRVRRSVFVDDVVVATTTAPEDDVIRECAARAGALCFSGSRNDVLDRTVRAAQMADAQIVVIIDGDTPLLDPQVMDSIIRIYLEERPDYAANTLESSFPCGFEVQVCTLSVLAEVNRSSRDPAHHEHVTLALYEEPGRYRVRSVRAPSDLVWPDLRLTLDTPEDYALISAVYDALYGNDGYFGIREVVSYLRMHPELLQLNASVQQKPVR